MTKLSLSGIIPPLPSPTTIDGVVNVPVLRKLVEHAITNGASGVIPLGGVGEFNSLSASNRLKIVEEVAAAVNGRVPVLAGVVQSSLHDAVASARAFKAAGAEIVLTIPPYYQKPTQAGVRDYFRRFKDMVEMPVMLYDTPNNTHLVIDPIIIAAMVDDGSIDAMKASNGSVEHFNSVMYRVGDRIPVLVGETREFVVFLAMGAAGGTIGNSSFMPRYFRTMYDLVKANRLPEALAAHRKLIPLVEALAAGGYFASFKQAFRFIGLDCGNPLPPLMPVSEDHMEKVRVELDKLRADGTLKDEVWPA